MHYKCTNIDTKYLIPKQEIPGVLIVPQKLTPEDHPKYADQNQVLTEIEYETYRPEKLNLLFQLFPDIHVQMVEKKGDFL